MLVGVLQPQFACTVVSEGLHIACDRDGGRARVTCRQTHDALAPEEFVGCRVFIKLFHVHLDYVFLEVFDVWVEEAQLTAVVGPHRLDHHVYAQEKRMVPAQRYCLDPHLLPRPAQLLGRQNGLLFWGLTQLGEFVLPPDQQFAELSDASAVVVAAGALREGHPWHSVRLLP